jgi:hypothetical protein
MRAIFFAFLLISFIAIPEATPALNVSRATASQKDPCMVACESQICSHVLFCNDWNSSLNDAANNGGYLSTLIGGYDVTCIYNNSRDDEGHVTNSKLRDKGVSPCAHNLLYGLIDRLLQEHPTTRIVIVGHHRAMVDIKKCLGRCPDNYKRQLSILVVAPSEEITTKEKDGVEAYQTLATPPGEATEQDHKSSHDASSHQGLDFQNPAFAPDIKAFFMKFLVRGSTSIST